MLAEIFLIKLETKIRETTPSGSTRQTSDPRFVPVTPPKRS